MSEFSSLSLFDKPWARSALLSAGSLLILCGLSASILGFDTMGHFWSNCSGDQRLLFIVLSSCHFLYCFIVLMARQAQELSWSGKIAQDSDAERFSNSVLLQRHFESYALDRYGMNSNIFWPRLYLILPSEVRTVVSQARNNYVFSALSAGLLTWWFSVACPIWCGALTYTAVSNRSHEWLFWATLLLFLFYVLLDYVNIQTYVFMRKLQILVGLMVFFFDRVLSDYRIFKFLLLFLLGFLLWYCGAGSYHQWESWSMLLSKRPGWDPGSVRIASVTIEIMALGLLSQTCQWWFLNAAENYGSLSCTIFDLYRTQLANALKISLSDDPISDRKAWKSSAHFLQEGALFRGDAEDEIERRVAPKNLLQALRQAVATDWKRAVKLLAKRADSKDLSNQGALQKSLNSSKSIALLLFVCESSRIIVLTLAISLFLPWCGLLSSQAPPLVAIWLTLMIFFLIPCTACLIITIATCRTIFRTYLATKHLPRWPKSGPFKLLAQLTMALIINTEMFFVVRATMTTFLMLAIEQCLPMKFANFWSLSVSALLLTYISAMFDFVRNKLTKKLWQTWTQPKVDELPTVAQ